jgi:hypothetical protein
LFCFVGFALDPFVGWAFWPVDPHLCERKLLANAECVRRSFDGFVYIEIAERFETHWRESTAAEIRVNYEVGTKNELARDFSSMRLPASRGTSASRQRFIRD